MNRQTKAKDADPKTNLISLADERKHRELQPLIRACEALYYRSQEDTDHEQKKKER